MRQRAFDLRTTIRGLVRNPWFSLIAVATLSLGLAANVLIFSIVNAVRRPELPYRDPARILVVREAFLPNGWTDVPMSLAMVMDLREQANAFTAIAAYSQRRVSLSDDRQVPVRVQAAVVTSNMWSTLGVEPIIGRTFTVQEDRAGASPTVMIGHRLWRDRYGEDPAILRRSVSVDGISRQIVGVMPASFRFPETEDLWLPLGLVIDADVTALQRREARTWGALARLRPESSPAAARDELAALAARAAERYPHVDQGWTFVAVPATDEAFQTTGPFFSALQAGAILVLLLMCGNLANVMLARGEQRRREFAVRASLGASRSHLIGLLLSEAAVLSAVAAILALVIAAWAITLLPAVIPEAIPFFIRFRIDSVVVLFTVVLTAATALCAGLGSALRTPHADPFHVLAAGSATLAGKAHAGRLRSVLLGVQTTIAAGLLASTLVVAFGLVRFNRVELGFDPSNTLLVEVPLPAPSYAQQDSGRTFVRRVLDRIGALPGVRVAAASAPLPIASSATGATAGVGSADSIDIESAAGVTGSNAPETYQAVTPGYFTAAGIELVSGRVFVAADSSGNTPVAVINAQCARRYFGGADPIGRRIRFGRTAETRRWRVIVGVVENTIVQPMDPEIDPRIYVPYEQDPSRLLTLTIRTTHVAPQLLSTGVSHAIRDVDPQVAIETPTSAEQRLRAALWPVRFFNGFAAGLAVLGLIVAGAGVYGLTQYLTIGRTREMAVRAALGAAPLDIARLIVGQTGAPVLNGIIIGLAVSLGISNVLQHLLPGIPGIDALALGTAALTLTAIGGVALALPALRAARMDPAEALRQE